MTAERVPPRLCAEAGQRIRFLLNRVETQESTHDRQADPATFYTIPNGCFKSYIDRDRNKVLNRLDHMALKDEAGNQVPVSETHARIFQHIAELEHDMFHIRLIETGNQTFVYLELNVNLWTPCCLYWYDRDADAMVLLHEWDEEEVIGLRLRNITLAGQDKSN